MNEPNFSSPADIYSFLSENFGGEPAEVVGAVEQFLKWANSPIEDRCEFEVVYEETFVYYMVAGILEKFDVIEYGVSIRNPWLTPLGIELLEGLEKNDISNFEE